MSSEKIEKTIAHPLEDMFGIESGTTSVPAVKRESTTVSATEYDEKDDEIDSQMQEVYDISLEAYEAQAQEAELVEGKYRARNHEIAAQYLSIALNAATNKATLKTNKDKLTLGAAKLAASARGPQTTPDGLIVGDRNSILKALRDAKKIMDEKKPIEMEDD